MPSHGRLLYLTSGWSRTGRGSFAGRRLVKLFQDSGWETLVRYAFVPDRKPVIDQNPDMASDATDEVEFREFAPDVVLSEGGLYLAKDWKFSPRLALDFVEGGGVFLVLDAGTNHFLNASSLPHELSFFGAAIEARSRLTAPQIFDEDRNPGNPYSIPCRPAQMQIDDWLRPAFDGVEFITALTPVAMVPAGDVAASAEPTAKIIEADIFRDQGARWSTPFATIRQHGLGYAGIVAAIVTHDDLTNAAPGNRLWLTQLASLLVDEAQLMRQVRGTNQVPPQWEGDPRPTAELIEAPEDSTLEIKETVRYNVRAQRRDKAMEEEVAEAVQEFWNTDGGVVLIGVQDNPRVVTGIARDLREVQNKNEDGLGLFIAGLLGERISSVVASKVRMRIESVGDERVIRLDVPRGGWAAWLDDQRFRIRRQNGGIELKGPELTSYLETRFPRR